MIKLQQFMSADAPSLLLQEKFLKSENKISKESLYGSKFSVHQDSLAVRETGTIQRLPESIWLLAHKIVAFSQSYVQQSNWSSGLLNWMFVTEPWWTLTPRDYARYASLFSKADWFNAMEILSVSHRNMTKHIESQTFASEQYALLFFLKDSQKFVEQMYKRL